MFNPFGNDLVKTLGYLIYLIMLKRMSTFAAQTFNFDFFRPRTVKVSSDPHQPPRSAGKVKQMMGSVDAAHLDDQHLLPP